MTSPMTQASGLFGLILGLRGVRAYWAYLSEMTRKPRLWEPWVVSNNRLLIVKRKCQADSRVCGSVVV